MKYKNKIQIVERLLRFRWRACSILFRLLPGKLFWIFRFILLKMNGCSLSLSSYVYSSAKIVSPHTLEIGKWSTIGPNCYLGGGAVKIAERVTISQNAMLLPSSHNISGVEMRYFEEEISLDDYVWIAAGAIVGPGVHLERRVILGAGAVYFEKKSSLNCVYVGNPAKKVKKRE